MGRVRLIGFDPVEQMVGRDVLDVQSRVTSPSPDEFLKNEWDLGSGRPSWSMPEVIAVRGQRIAAVSLVNDFGNDMHTDMTMCVCFNPQLKLQQRLVFFDVDARDAAIAEVDRMQEEIDD